MVRNAKRKGTVFENKVKHLLEEWGYLVTRAAGSFGVDLIGIKKERLPIFVNVKLKRVYLGPVERKQMRDDAEKYGAIPILAFKHIPDGKKNGKPYLQLITEKWSSPVKAVILEAPKEGAPDLMRKLFL